ncbi:MAG: LysR family transcriptional regulator, partial [Aeromicrobium sp.]
MRSVSSLRVLAALDGADSFSAAADELGMSQSAVSQHIAALEQQVGLPLVQRGTRPVDVTVAGRVLAGHAAAVLARLEAAGLDLAELAGHHHRRLRVGGFPTALATFVPRALALLASQSPDVTFTVVDDHLQGLVPRLLNRELDVAL